MRPLLSGALLAWTSIAAADEAVKGKAEPVRVEIEAKMAPHMAEAMACSLPESQMIGRMWHFDFRAGETSCASKRAVEGALVVSIRADGTSVFLEADPGALPVDEVRIAVTTLGDDLKARLATAPSTTVASDASPSNAEGAQSLRTGAISAFIAGGVLVAGGIAIGLAGAAIGNCGVGTGPCKGNAADVAGVAALSMIGLGVASGVTGIVLTVMADSKASTSTSLVLSPFGAGLHGTF